MKSSPLKYYSRKDIQKAILKDSQNKEFIPKFGDSFGKRPDMLQFASDIEELAKQGATSFHISEERWSNPLLLKPGMAKQELDNIRLGWDCILDIDCDFLEYSKICAELIIEALKFHDVDNIGLKHSGNTGFHIGIPFESFPSKINNQETKLLFPDGVRVIASYIKQMIKQPLLERLLDLNSLGEISQATKKPLKDLKEKDTFNPYSILEIDSILISSRHLYRSPYSLNEKSSLVSIPIKPSQLKTFKLSQAKMESIEPSLSFLPKVQESEASNLIIQAFDSLKKQHFIQEETEKKSFQIPQNAIPSSYFPPCIEVPLKNGLQDGKKRFLFILYNFLRSIGYSHESIESIIQEWNKKNPHPLKEGYVLSQLSWHKRQKEPRLPPNCSNLSYYQDIGIKCPEEICSKCTNPVNFTKRKYFAQLKYNKPKKRTRKVSKSA